MSALLPIRALTQHLGRQQHLSLVAVISLGIRNTCCWEQASLGISWGLSAPQLLSTIKWH